MIDCHDNIDYLLEFFSSVAFFLRPVNAKCICTGNRNEDNLTIIDIMHLNI